jgi:hypothetical protein
MDFWTKLKTWFTGTALPTLESFVTGAVHTEVAALTPIAQNAVAQLTTEEATALATGDTKDTGHILAKVVAGVAAQAEAESINSVLMAVGAAIPPKTAS